MTIAIAIRTDSAVVFAADSKITTRGVVGLDEKGEPVWQEQTYDNATKVVHDPSRTLMAMVAGSANIGRTAATDFISTQSFGWGGSRDDQDQRINDLVNAMVARKSDYWKTTKAAPETWPGPTVLLAAPELSGNTPRVWRVNLEGEGAKTTEILTAPWIHLEGAYDETFSLLYGIHSEVLKGMSTELKLPPDSLWTAWREMKYPRPLDKLNLWAMPIQDAIDMAVFLAMVQVEMDRFLPGIPACGGPIDVMVLQMAPTPGITAYPGKVVHHPVHRRV
jgi:hypothetical protein